MSSWTKGGSMRLRAYGSSNVLCFGGEQAVLDQKFTRLKSWIHENGGYVHDALRLQKYEKSPYLTLRTKYEIGSEDVMEPCIGLPASIVVDRRTALEDLEAVLAESGCPPLYLRPTVEVLTVFIAYHKQLGEASKWYPAIASLPESPPCPWLKQIRDLVELEFDEELQQTVLQERSGNDLIAKQLHALYGQFLHLTRVQMLWAYAQAQSISFHEKEGSFWAPVVNFLLHDSAQPPLYQQEQARFVTWGWQDRLVSAGEHLKINICIENPLLLYLSRGIVTENL